MSANGWLGGEKLKPANDVERKEAETVEGMRKRIRKYARDDALVHSILETGRWNGLSGDDTMTMLAYYALLEREQFRDMVLEQTMLNPMPPLFIKPNMEPQ